MRSRFGKRTISFLLMIVMLLGVVPGTAWAYSVNGNTVTLTVGESTTVEVDGLLGTEVTNQATDDGVARYTVQHETSTSSPTTTRVTTMAAGTYILGNGSTWLSWNGSSLSSVSNAAQASSFVIKKSDNGWTIQTEDGKYLSIGGNIWGRTLTTSNNSSVWNHNNGFYQTYSYVFDYYLTADATVDRDDPNKAYAYSYTPGSTTYATSITFTGLKPGSTTVKIGDQDYTVVVEPLKENVELWLGVETQSRPVTGEVSDNDIAAFNTKNKSVVTVSRSGSNLAFTPVGEGTVAGILGNTQYTIDVRVPTYVVDITHSDGTSVTAPIPIKGVTDTTTYDLNAVVMRKTSSGDQIIPDAAISWAVTSGEKFASVDANGVVSFTGEDATVQVSAYYTVPGGGTDAVYDTVTFSVSKSEHTVPGDGTDDFPEYPNEGAIRFDKTSTAVGNFSETGLAMVELSMTGVPYTKGSEIDVVIMIDMSSSMTTARITAARESAVEALQAIVTNEDGSYNNNRVAVYTFNGWDGSGKPGVAQNYANAVDTILDLQSYTTKAMVTSATNAIEAAITNNKTDDGTNYAAALSKCDAVLAEARAKEGYNRKQFVIFVTDGEPTTGFAYDEGGQVKDYGYNQSYSQGYASQVYTKQEHYSTLMKNNGVSVYTVGIHLTGTATNAHTVLRKIAGTKEGNAYNGGEEYAAYAQFVAQGESADKLKDIFKSFVTAIKQAATDVDVVDKISPDYSMVFELPTGVTDEQTGGQKFYIQIVEYELDENKERKGDPVVLEKFWIEKGVWQHISGNTSCENSCSHVTIENGKVTYIDGTYFDTSFKYDADEQLLVWEADKLDTKELALQYFVYLDHHGADGSGESGTYPTNEYATISYKNYQDNQCQQEFPEPQLTYNGAQVSYVFYLVNENGEPVNRAGRVVPFAEAVYVTDVLTFATTWKGDDSTGELDAHYLAQEKVPDIFKLYDDNAYYEIHVFADPLKADYFILEGSGTGSTSTKVFNTKAGERYDRIGAYSATGGNYTSGQEKTYSVSSSTAAQMAGFDFANTTVAFAVTWTAELVPNTAVLDFGLPVIIDVATDDTLNGMVVGVRDSKPAGVAINSGSFTASRNVESVIRDSSYNIVGHAYVVSGTSVEVVLNKVLDKPATFYYEYEATFYDGSTLVNTCFYSSVTLVPATNVLYEENYISGTGWTSDSSGVGTAGGTAQSDKNAGPYGYDTAYQKSTGSSGTQFVAALTPEGNGRFAGNISFTFTGTGFDLIGSCSVDTATLMVRVDDAGGNYVKGYMVDTAFLNTHSVDGDGTIYQVPLVHEDGLTWGTYTVTITGAYMAYQDRTPDAMKLSIDGFRVYRTGAEAEHEAFVPGETGVTYVNILDAVRELNETIAYVDSTATGYDVSGYEGVGGPENEIYVKPGQSIALKTASIWHQVSLRSVTEKATSAVLKTENGQAKYDIAHNTEMYYTLEDEASGFLTITNTGEGLLAVGNVKLYSDDAEEASLAAVSAEDLPVVFAMLSRPIDPVFRPENLTATIETAVMEGQKFVTLTVTASTDVRKLIVNGAAVWAGNYTQVQQGLESEYVFKVLQIVSADETASFEVTAIDKNGTAADVYKISD